MASPQQNSSSPSELARLTFEIIMGHSFLNKSWSAGLEAPFLTLCEVKWCRWSPPVWPWVLKFIEVHQNLEPKHRTFPINLHCFGPSWWTKPYGKFIYRCKSNWESFLDQYVMVLLLVWSEAIHGLKWVIFEPKWSEVQVHNCLPILPLCVQRESISIELKASYVWTKFGWYFDPYFDWKGSSRGELDKFDSIMWSARHLDGWASF